ncbi:uncharacterized protein LOC117583794 [Drosophila guanche]|uniref:Uncharacterized protein n=1 Tax=Drosophila guanche TaxID=7266 RepID=A0A3B0JXM7_DROGU|nr:uncharacterized protein LOC117583794 [Drosophila guanche]SPP80260.1 Hypothetical predicted protein [Drosophila guanche]
MANEQSTISEQAELASNLQVEGKLVPDSLGTVLENNSPCKSGEYVRRLHDRLRQCVQRNNENMQESVKLLKELSDVCDSTLTTSSNTPKIKHLIRNFETIGGASGASAESSKQSSDMLEMRSLLLKFKTLNDEDLLRDCLMTFKCAKVKFEKLQTCLENMCSAPIECARPIQAEKKLSPSTSVSPSLREKILAFNKALGDGRETSKYFMDCFSSRCSFHDPLPETSVEEMKPPMQPWSRTNSGYEGDIDSEVEQAHQTSGQVD